MAKRKRAGQAGPTTLPVPAWREKLQSAVLRMGFHLHLSQPMLEYLCATADDVIWDRQFFLGLGQHCPDSWHATEASLVNRGLIQRKPLEVIRDRSKRSQGDGVDEAVCELTPAGRLIVELVKMTGLFVEASDASTLKGRA